MNREQLFKAMKENGTVYCINRATLRFNQCKVEMVGNNASRILLKGNNVQYRKNSKLYASKYRKPIDKA